MTIRFLFYVDIPSESDTIERMRKLIGDRQFYKMVFALVIPIMIQQGITSFVNLLDNIMVGALGTEAISAVSISNQILLIFQLAIFGGLGAISIYGAQFYGTKDMDGMRYAFRTKFIFCLLISALAAVILLLFSPTFISLFLRGDSNGGDLALTAQYAAGYITIILVGFVPFTFSQAYAGTLRETGETFMPMVASVAAILVNLVFNWLLIYGNLGFPKWGVYGAAVATSMSRFVELVILIIYTHRNLTRFTFMQGVYRSLKVPADLLKRIVITGWPLLLNEIMWSMSMTVMSQSYSTKGLDVVAATNIASTTWNIFMIFMIAMGSAVQIIVGQHLGMGEIEKAREIDSKLIFLTFVMNVVLGIILLACSGLIPLLYNVPESVRSLATQLHIISGLILPVEALVHVIYFTIRSGGRTMITFLFDSVYMWVVPVQLAYCLCHFTTLPIIPVYAIVQFSSIIKVIIGLLMLRSDFWAKKIV